MIKSISHNIILTLIFLFPFHLSIGQEISNNDQKIILPFSAKKIVNYFSDFNTTSLKDYELSTVKLDTIFYEADLAILHFTENKIYNSALVVENHKLFSETVENDNETNLVILFKENLKPEYKESPIKPPLRHDVVIRNGEINWVLKVESINQKQTEITISFVSTNDKYKKNFIKNFTSPNYSFMNSEIEKIYITNNFAKQITKYLEKNKNADATDIQPSKGN